jgi:diacylglycerol kinase (ATP)
MCNYFDVFQNSPHIAILPLGTGNDLARVLEWGSGYAGEEDVNDVLESLLKAKVTPLDRSVDNKYLLCK